jgi:hypothetical protein
MKGLIERVKRKAFLSRENPAKNLACAEFEVNNWLVSEFVIGKLIPVVGSHPYPLNELMLMTAAICRFQPSQIFEWGTNIGKAARIFYECAQHYGISTEIHSIDLPDDVEHGEHPGSERGKLVRGLQGVTLHQGDGLDTARRIWQSSGKKPGTLFFVDGDHAYESVFRELTGIARDILDPLILLHDTFFQSTGSGYNVGPHEAISKVLSGDSSGFRRIDSGFGLPGMTLLYRTSNLQMSFPNSV